jgi:hypothetical protein
VARISAVTTDRWIYLFYLSFLMFGDALSALLCTVWRFRMWCVLRWEYFGSVVYVLACVMIWRYCRIDIDCLSMTMLIAFVKNGHN